MKKSDKPKIIVIVGPTASGKSGLGIELAKKYNGEIISADSRQIYRKLDIGTAKITRAEMQGIPHHLIDILAIDQSYSALQFKKDAQTLISEITQRGKLPIIVGGTFFYIDTLLGRISAPKVPPNAALREKLEKLSTTKLYERLSLLDSERAESIDKRNRRRLIRALEIVEALGHVPKQRHTELLYNVLMLGITIEKDELRKKMRTRAQKWLQQGFVEEVRDLLACGVSRKRLAEIGFEYQLCLELIDGVLSKEDFMTSFEQKNWQYAKRQFTWLKRDRSIVWVFLSEKSEIDLLVEQFLLN